ncbi:MAG: hypothetical protein GF398_08605 [Chitinivibrionales bacterium]|nr:hypothetical protein [Chitinivibrionales bacterium]
MEDTWSTAQAQEHIYEFDNLNIRQQKQLLNTLNAAFPPSRYRREKQQRRAALINTEKGRRLLEGAQQHYPHLIYFDDVAGPQADMRRIGFVLTAGGEGERLRQSLMQQGAAEHELTNFTKATWPLPHFHGNFGALHCNLAVIADLCQRSNRDIPVIVTTGPQGSTTARVIPQVIDENDGFGLKQLKILAQNERLHLTDDEKIVWQLTDDEPHPVTNPDETGGPLAGLGDALPNRAGQSGLDWLRSCGGAKLLVLQATALYDPHLIHAMVNASQAVDALGVGIVRESFPADDPYGSFVLVNNRARPSLAILEKDIRNEFTRKIRDESGKHYLPFNTGFYAFDAELLEKNNLPDYATPPKEIRPDLPRSPKIGYAATDILPLAHHPAVLGVGADLFAVIKKADDLPRLAQLGRKCGLDALCRKVEKSQGNM